MAAMTTLLAACGTAAGAPTTPIQEPRQPAESPAEAPVESPAEDPVDDPAEERETDGTITVAEGMAFSGPGNTIAEALFIGESVHPALVNGVLFRDTDGTIYLATSVTDEATFEGPMLEVLGIDNPGASWDMANAELLDLEEANGIVFNRNAQILGFLEVR